MHIRVLVDVDICFLKFVKHINQFGTTKYQFGAFFSEVRYLRKQ